MSIRFCSAVSLALLAVFFLGPEAWADSEGSVIFEVSALDTLEPNTIGFTFDDDDVTYLDVKLSVKISLAPYYIHKVYKDLDVNLGLTGRFGQYLGTRHSSPVIGKRYNPELFLRHRLLTDGYIDLGYAHESNGQAITTPEAFEQAKDNAEQAEFAKDLISRGWDYLRLALKSPALGTDASKSSLTFYLTLKYFLTRGALQGDAEEYNDWENDPEGKPRDEVNGVGSIVKFIYCFERAERKCIDGLKVAAIYETGYDPLFRYNTLRGELGFKILELPVILWGSSGYNSDLAQYYKRVDSWGFALEIGGF